MPKTNEKPTKLLHVQMLRAFAALFVVVTHALHEIREMLAARGMLFDDKIYPGDFGVDIFFIISGFIMVFVSRDAFGSARAGITFIVRRVARVAPLYWIMTLVVVAIVIFAPQLMDNGTKDPRHWIGSFLFIPVERPTDGLIRPLLGIGWTLQYEMSFYILFAIALFWPIKRAVPGVLAAIVLIVSAGLILQPENAQLKFWSDPIMLEFAAGVVLGWVYLKGYRIDHQRFWGLMYWGLLILAFSPTFTEDREIWRVVFYGIPALIIMVACTLTRDVDSRPIPKFLISLGASSYALYLTHPFVLGGLKVIWVKLGMLDVLNATVMPWVFVSGSLVICALFGHGVHRLVEFPITRLLLSKLNKKPADQGSQQTIRAAG